MLQAHMMSKSDAQVHDSQKCSMNDAFMIPKYEQLNIPKI